MWPLQRQQRKRDARLLASTQGPDRLQPRHASDLEIAQVLTVLLLRLSWELGREELDGVHRRNERVYVVLRKVATAPSGSLVRLLLAGQRRLAIMAYTRNRPLRLSCPDCGFSSPVRSFILFLLLAPPLGAQGNELTG